MHNNKQHQKHHDYSYNHRPEKTCREKREDQNMGEYNLCIKTTVLIYVCTYVFMYRKTTPSCFWIERNNLWNIFHCTWIYKCYFRLFSDCCGRLKRLRAQCWCWSCWCCKQGHNQKHYWCKEVISEQWKYCMLMMTSKNSPSVTVSWKLSNKYGSKSLSKYHRYSPESDFSSCVMLT